MTNNLKDAIKFIFLPALFLSILFSGSSLLFQFSQNTLIGKQIGYAQIPLLKVCSIFPQVIFVLVLLIFSIYKPFEKVFRGVLITLMGMVVLFSIFLLFLENLEWGGAPDVFGIYKPFVVYWPITFMYCGLGLLNFKFFIFLIWGFVNRFVSPTEGIKYYIPLALILTVSVALVTKLRMGLLNIANWHLTAIIAPALILMLCSLLIFNWSWKRLPENLTHLKKPLASKQIRFPYLSSAYLLAGGIMTKNLLNILFKSQLKSQLHLTSSYLEYIGHYSMYVGSTTLIISVIWGILGSWLILKKGWKTVAFYTSISIFVGWVLYLSLSISWISQSIFTGLLTGTTSVLFYPLIQMLYLYLPYQNRFRTKIITEMMALPIIKTIPSLINQGILIAFGSIAAMALYFKVLASIFLILLLVVSKTVGSKIFIAKTKN